MRYFYLVVLLIVCALSIPVLLWYMEPEVDLRIAIIDKTVPDDSYREHLGITWLQNHLKLSGGPYDAADNYYGFQPDPTDQTYEIRPLPSSYDSYDVIYLADTYGVYTDDLPWLQSERAGARSEKVYGGLEMEEWEAIRERLTEDRPSLLIAEFNTFASPTNREVQMSITDYLGLDYTGWTGRYFAELDPELNEEIPQWIIDQFGSSWEHSGPGFVLVNDYSYQVVVLETGKHVQDEGISLSFTDEGRELFGLRDSPNYPYWFDIVTPLDGAVVLANYSWELTAEGRELLEKHGIPSEFAAVIQHAYGTYESYYLAGDYNDAAHMPRYYQMKGLPLVYKFAQMFSDQSFYWSTYVPMMTKIFERFSAPDQKIEDHDPSAEPRYIARVRDQIYEVKIDDEWVPITIKGVNMGMAKPGTFPGEAAITEEEYYRWFEYIGEMNANTVRVYTLHPPGFYRALKRYNDAHDEKIYIMHGVWINEESLVESLDAFEEENMLEFQEEMRRIVDVIHGDTIIDPVPGHASGVYRADISDYVIGWILGIEWYPFMVLETNEKYPDLGDYDGEYFSTRDARAFEYWLAMQMDLITSYELEHYQAIRPMSFTNWVTTDILDHPSDSTNQEDIVSVDPNRIYTKGLAKLTGQYASYHIYPYYPDFLNHDEKYVTYIDHRGQPNNYAGYLAELHESHRLPILVAEFGVPSSRGLTHENPFGWNQGFLTEQEQGEIIQHMFEDMMEEGLLGGLIFTWQDEWFKRTWNTMDYDNPNRRPYWSNAQTNELQFGLLSFDRHKIQVDGEVADWEQEALYQQDSGSLRALYVDHDERYLYIRLDVDPDRDGYPVILFDVIPDHGNTYMKDMEGLAFANGLEFFAQLNGDESRILIDAYYDFYQYLYGYELEMIPRRPVYPNSGEFTEILYVLNKDYYNPEKDITLPFSYYETGKLREGNGNPAADDYDSLADYYISDDGIIELRIPWMLIQAKDPSQKEFMGDLHRDGRDASVFVDQIYIGALYIDESGSVTDAMPAIQQQQMPELKGYTWDDWQMPKSQERLKRSYEIVQELFAQY